MFGQGLVHNLLSLRGRGEAQQRCEKGTGWPRYTELHKALLCSTVNMT